MTDGDPTSSLAAGAVAVLATPRADAKAECARSLAAAWRAGRISEIGTAVTPARPARPEKPPLRPPREVPRRRIGAGASGRIALLHALAHIELNAIDLACDVLARFSDGQPRAFCDDWLQVADEEAGHYLALAERLSQLGAAYGDLPAHDGLWQAAEHTADDLLARLAVVPMVLEARGLDVTPGMIERLEAVGDEASAAVLRRIYAEEIGHVAIGTRWFEAVARGRGLDPRPTWQALVRERFKGALKPPFNEDGRDAAGFPADFYAPLAAT